LQEVRHGLVEEGRDYPAVDQALPALVLPLGNERHDTLFALPTEAAQMKAVRVIRPAGETPSVLMQHWSVLHVSNPALPHPKAPVRVEGVFAPRICAPQKTLRSGLSLHRPDGSDASLFRARRLTAAAA